MIPILFPIEQFRTLPKNSIAISVCLPKRGKFLHSGIVFNDKGNIFFIHLVTYRSLRCDNHDQILNDYTHFIYTNFAQLIKTDPHFFKRKSLIAYLHAIFEKNENTIPYSFLFKNTSFDQNLTIKLGEGEYGLTCSTFVMAVLESHGIFLCDKDSWPEREDDKEIRKRIIAIYKKDPRLPDPHIKIMESELSCVRYRPEEVLCSSGKYPLPSKFIEVIDCSKKVLSYINSN